MDIQIGSWLEAVEEGFGLLPSAIIAALLLAGPTGIWLLYRFVVQPRSSRYRTASGGGFMWVCPACRSLNELRSDRCYRCDRVPNEEDLHIIDPEIGLPIPLNQPMPSATAGIPVGPGHDDLTELPGLAGLRGVTASEARPPVTDRERVAVGPGRTRASRPRRAVVVARPRPVRTDPDDPSAA